MSSILIKQVQDYNVPSASPGYVRLFSDINNGGNLSYKDVAGDIFNIGGGATATPITYNTLFNSLIPNSSLVPFSFYEITDFRTVYDRPNYNMAGVPKSTTETHFGETQSIVVFALSPSLIDTKAYQSEYPLDVIKYDFSFTQSEINGTTALGRIVKRVDEYGNRTDYDHRQVELLRYKTYSRNSKLSGVITNVNFTTGFAQGSGTSFVSELSINDVILLDTFSTLNYNIGLKIKTISNNLLIEFWKDAGFTGSVNSISVDLYSSVDTGFYYDWKEVYVNQENEGDYQTFKTFQYENESPVYSVDNFIGDYSKYFYSQSLPYLLPNIVISQNSYKNYIDGLSHNFTLPENSFNNKLSINFNKNFIYNSFYDNNIGHNFENNLIFSNFHNNTGLENSTYNSIGNLLLLATFSKNKIRSDFHNNKIDGDFTLNIIGDNFTNNNIEGNFNGNEIKDNFLNNIIALNFGYDSVNLENSGNIIGDNFTSNSIGVFGGVNANFVSNNIGNYFGYYNGTFSSNIINTNFKSNTIKDYFAGNTIEDNFMGNIIGNYFIGNQIANNFGFDPNYSEIKGNEIGDNFRGNIVGSISSLPANFWSNKIGNSFGISATGSLSPNNIEGDFTENTLGDNFYGNVIFSSFNSNNILNRFRDNLVNSGFFSNKIGNDFVSNLVDNNFMYNFIGDECQTNNFGLDFTDNKIGNLFTSNYLEAGFQFNDIGNLFYGNTAANTFTNNTIQDFSFGNQIEIMINSHFGPGFIYNVVGNSIGNIIGSSFSYNIVGNELVDNKIGNRFINNLIQNGFGQGGGNIIQDDFINNNIGQFFSNNKICSGFQNNQTYTSFQFNDIQSPVSTTDFIEYYGNISSFTFSAVGGTDGTYSSVSGITNAPGYGLSASFDIVVVSASVSSVTIASSGILYQPGDVITIDGTQIGGLSITDDVSIFINTVSATPSVYENYNSIIFSRQGPTNRLSFFDSSDSLIIKDINT